MAKCRPRFAEAELERLLKTSDAVLIEGPRFCGKAAVAERFAESALHLGGSGGGPERPEMLDVEPSMLLRGGRPRLICEWQLDAKLQNAVMRDIEGGGGPYILTGSAEAGRPPAGHPGSKRVARMAMTTMSLYESGDSNGDVSLADLFDGKDTIGRSGLELEDLERLVVRGGWPDAGPGAAGAAEAFAGASWSKAPPPAASDATARGWRSCSGPSPGAYPRRRRTPRYAGAWPRREPACT